MVSVFMLSWLTRMLRNRRAKRYLATYPDDAPIVEPILGTRDMLHAESARQVAEMVAGRRFSDAEWERYGPRWERAWLAIA
jgi:hypothetical protein